MRYLWLKFGKVTVNRLADINEKTTKFQFCYFTMDFVFVGPLYCYLFTVRIPKFFFKRFPKKSVKTLKNELFFHVFHAVGPLNIFLFENKKSGGVLNYLKPRSANPVTKKNKVRE
jgi:hypothetical protein